MPTKSLRILLAAERHEQVLHLEQMLNRLGYFRVAPVHSFEQLLTMVESAIEPFDLLIANSDLARRAGVDLPRFCQGNPEIRHALLYQSAELELPDLSDGQGAINVSLTQLPDIDTLKSFMDAVDSPHDGRANGIAKLGLRLNRRRYAGRTTS